MLAISAQHCSVHCGLCSSGLCHYWEQHPYSQGSYSKPYTLMCKRERVISFSSSNSPLHSPGKIPYTYTINNHGLVFEFYCCSPFSVLAYFFISSGIDLLEVRITGVMWAARGSIYTAGKSGAMLSFLSQPKKSEEYLHSWGTFMGLPNPPFFCYFGLGLA